MAKIKMQEEPIAKKLANEATAVAAQQLCDILADKKKVNEAIRSLECFDLGTVLKVEPNARNTDFDWVKFIHSDKFNPKEHVVDGYLNERIPYYMSGISSHLQERDSILFNNITGTSRKEQIEKSIMLYAACLEIDRTNFAKQHEFYAILKTQAQNMKDNGRKQEAEMYLQLSKSYQVSLNGALKNKFEPISLLLLRISNEEKQHKHPENLTPDQLSGIAKRMLSILEERKRSESTSKFFKKAGGSINDTLSSLRALLLSDSKEQVEAIVKSSPETPSKRR